MVGPYYTGGGVNPGDPQKKVSASEPFACSLQAHEKVDTPIAWVHAPEADEDSVYRAAAARPMDSSRDDPAARRRAQARQPGETRENPRLCRSFSTSGGLTMGQQGRKTQQKRETANLAGKTSNPNPQNRHRKPKQIRMGKG